MVISFEEILEERGVELTENDLDMILKHNLEDISKMTYWYLGAIFPMVAFYLSIRTVFADYTYGVYLDLILGITMMCYLVVSAKISRDLLDSKTVVFNEYLDVRQQLKEIKKAQNP